MRELIALFAQPLDEGLAHPCRRVKASALVLRAARGEGGTTITKWFTNDNDLQRGREREPLCMGCAVTVVAA